MYILSELFFYKIIFVIEILIAMHLFSFKQIKKNHYVIKLIISILVCIGLAIAFPIPQNLYNTFYTSFMFLFLFIICTISLGFVYEIPFRIIFFISITAYTMQHFAHESFSLIVSIFNMAISPTLGFYGSNIVDFSKFDLKTLFYAFIYLDVYLLTYWVTYSILGKKINKKELIIENYYMLIISGVVLLVDIILNAVIVYINDNYNKAYTIVSCIYNLLCCSMVLYIQFSLATNKHLKSELQTTMQLLKQAEDQYKSSKENVDIINLKCHDLKHQIHNIGKARDLQNDVINEIEETINIYDTIYNTGLEALDVILGEKDMLCRKENIRFTSIVDGKLLSFLSESDVYSLFGNILDNAIEANRKLNNEARVIHLSIKKVHNFIVIQEYNGYDVNIVTENGIIKSTKNDKTWHGYGLKSIQYIVEKYHGELKIETKNQTFNLNIIFSDKS